MGNRQAAQLNPLELMKRAYGPGCAAKCERVLTSLPRATFTDAESLIQFHDSLLFLRAFPQSPTVVRLADQLLASAEPQVERFNDSSASARIFDDETVSGIAGTTVANTWTFELARQLVARHAQQFSAEWEFDERYRQMATVLPASIPLLDDDSFVEADTPYLKWINAASGRHKSDLQWLLGSFEKLPISLLVRTSLYDSLGVNLRWGLRGSSASRTYARRPVSQLFCHDAPLLQRKQVSVLEEMDSPPLSLRKLNRNVGRKIIDMAQDALAVRYRELQGSTCGDPDQAFQADVGRGVQLFIWGLAAEWRLPLRAYYAGFTLKNGVPINYFEAIALFEWVEVGFNTFYAFREGETAWIYSKVLHLLRQLAGVTCISVYPYQIGQDNEEAIKSGAFWFYRKLGFRPGRADLLKIAELEEQQLARNPRRRTSACTLRKLAEGHMFFEFGGTEKGGWDTFSTRTLGLAVQRKMADEFNGDAGRMRRTVTARLSKMLEVSLETWKVSERWAFSNFALVLSLVPGLARWTHEEKRSLLAIIRAKAGPSETRYLRLLQKHPQLRESLLLKGSEPKTAKST